MTPHRTFDIPRAAASGRREDCTARRLIVLGSTGSIGAATLEVVAHLRAHGMQFDIVGLAAGSNAAMLAEQAAEHGVRHVANAESGDHHALANLATCAKVFTGPDAARELIEAVAQQGDLVVAAIVGSTGIPATIAAIDCGCDIALANKETLVAAGELVMTRASDAGVSILPIDSEHSAAFQCLQCGRSIDEVQRIVITCSGGPFRTWPAERIATASLDEALAHPTWDMGRKVTIDSASLMNKALEVIEAHWLFGPPGQSSGGLAAERIEVVIHPQSIVHGFVEFIDGSVVAQLSPPDMRMPIQYALTWPQRIDGCARRIDWSALSQLDFEPPDTMRFPALGLAFDVIRRGGNAGAVFNAANEAAVNAFIDGRIQFGQISGLVASVLDEIPHSPIRSIDDVFGADQAARRAVNELSRVGCRAG